MTKIPRIPKTPETKIEVNKYYGRKLTKSQKSGLLKKAKKSKRPYMEIKAEHLIKLDKQKTIRVNKALAENTFTDNTSNWKCKVCGCTDLDCSQCIKVTGKPCTWVEYELCSRCKTEIDMNDTSPKINSLEMAEIKPEEESVKSIESKSELISKEASYEEMLEYVRNDKERIKAINEAAKIIGKVPDAELTVTAKRYVDRIEEIKKTMPAERIKPKRVGQPLFILPGHENDHLSGDEKESLEIKEIEENIEATEKAGVYVGQTKMDKVSEIIDSIKKVKEGKIIPDNIIITRIEFNELIEKMEGLTNIPPGNLKHFLTEFIMEFKRKYENQK